MGNRMLKQNTVNDFRIIDNFKYLPTHSRGWNSKNKNLSTKMIHHLWRVYFQELNYLYREESVLNENGEAATELQC